MRFLGLKFCLPFEKSKQKTGDEECLAASDETLADSDYAGQG